MPMSPEGGQGLMARSIPVALASDQPPISVVSTNALGQKVMASSSPVAIASDQSAVPVNVLASVALDVTDRAARLAGHVALDSGGTLKGATVAANSLPVTIATDQGAVPVTGAFYQGTQPVSAASLPLPAGAAQDATLTGGTAKAQMYDGANVIGTAAHPVKTDPTGTTTQPVSAASLPLPTGAALEAGHLATIDTNVALVATAAHQTDGNQKTQVTNFPATQPVSIASMPSTPVTGTFWQGTQPVSGSVSVSNFPGTQPISAAALPLPTGAATEAGNLATILANQTNGNGKVQVISLPLPTGAVLEAGGNAEATFNLLSEILREMRLQTLLIREGLGVDHDVDDLRVEQESTYDQ